VAVARPRTIRTALRLRRAGLASTAALEMLGEVLDHVRLVAEGLAQHCSVRMLGLTPEDGRTARSWQDMDRVSVAMAEGIIDLLAEAFRVALENCSETIMTGLVFQQSGVALELDEDAFEVVDNG
jgi:hypothetical protein